MTAVEEISSAALRTAIPSAVTRPAAIAAWARARLSNRPRATRRRSARSRVVMVVDYSSARPRESGDPARTSSLDSRLRGNERYLRALRELHRFAADVLPERFERLGDDAFGVEAGLGVHGVGRVLVDVQVRQHHRTDFKAAIERAVFGERLHDEGAKAADRAFLDGEQHF